MATATGRPSDDGAATLNRTARGPAARNRSINSKAVPAGPLRPVHVAHGLLWEKGQKGRMSGPEGAVLLNPRQPPPVFPAFFSAGPGSAGEGVKGARLGDNWGSGMGVQLAKSCKNKAVTAARANRDASGESEEARRSMPRTTPRLAAAPPRPPRSAGSPQPILLTGHPWVRCMIPQCHARPTRQVDARMNTNE